MKHFNNNFWCKRTCCEEGKRLPQASLGQRHTWLSIHIDLRCWRKKIRRL